MYALNFHIKLNNSLLKGRENLSLFMTLIIWLSAIANIICITFFIKQRKISNLLCFILFILFILNIYLSIFFMEYSTPHYS